jgi:DNA polymerase
MLQLGLDGETRGVVDLRRVGAHKYAAHPDTDILCVAFAMDDGAVELWTPGAPCPDLIVHAVTDGWTLHAFNANFDRLIWHHVLTPRYGWPKAPRLEQWRCTQAAAQASALPNSLEGVAAALQLPFRKDPEGHAAMLRLSRPRKPKKGEDPTIIYWGGRDGDLELLYRYNRGDVEQERAVCRHLPPLSDAEQALWCLDAKINDYGFAVDLVLAKAAEKVVDQERAATNVEIAALTDGKITSTGQVARILAFAREHGHEMQSLRRRSVSAVLARNPDDAACQLLRLRRDGARSSVAKLPALFAHAGTDNRIRGALKYHGASTGRWSGNGFQPHNLKRVETENFDVDAAIDAILTRNLDRVREFGPPMTIVGDVARGLICAPPGHALVCADFSTIEARILAWYAGEDWKLAAFRDYDRTGDPALDPYLTAAARILKRRVDPEDDIGRHLGKTCELAFGFGGGLGAWRAFDNSDTHSDADVERYKSQWRSAHPATTRFWRRLESGIKKAIRTGERITLGNLAFELVNGTFFITLPSGRRLAYPQARLVPGKFDNTTDIAFFDNARGGWAETRAWFGVFTENVISATARDLLAAALLRIDAAGYRIVLHVHDEIVAEVPEGFRDAEAFRRLMVELPAWAAGLPIAAKVRIGKRYSKSKPRTEAPVREIAQQALDFELDFEEREFVDDF